jgi:hypothetical protein
MAITKVKNIFSTYTFDDITESKNYHRVLFKPGVSVQARELTEMQSQLQRQIDYHGQYSFAEGSRVIGGELALNVEYDYVKVESSYVLANGNANPASSFINSIATTAGAKLTSTSGVEAEVIQVITESGVDQADNTKTGILDSGFTSDPLTIYVKYIKGSGSTSSNQFVPGEVITSSTNAAHTLMVGQGTDTNLNAAGTQASAITNAIGKGSKITINEGVYFLSGNFVYVAADSIILEKYDSTPSNIIGLSVTESIATSVQDASLVDNAAGFPNVTAPGADRYKIATQLIKEPLASPNSIYTKYITLLEVENGIIRRDVAPAAEVDTGLTRRLAERTNEESGNYSLKPFVLDIREHLNTGTNQGYRTAGANGGSADKYVVGIEPNISYVNGYRTENVSTEYVEVDKPRETSTAPFDFSVKNAVTSSLPLGNYVRVRIGGTGYTGGDALGLPDITNFSELALSDSSAMDGNDPVALVDNISMTHVSAGSHAGTYYVSQGVGGVTGANGTGAKFKIMIDDASNVTIEVTNGGNNYNVNSTFVVPGATFNNGVTSANNLTFDVAQLGHGRARCRAVTVESDEILRLYLFDYVVTSGSFGQIDTVTQLNTATGGAANNDFTAKFVTQIGAAPGKKYDTQNNSAVWRLPYNGIKDAEASTKPIYYIQKRVYIDDAGADNTTTITSVFAGDETLVSTTGVPISIGSGAGSSLVNKNDATAEKSGTSLIINHADIADNSSVCAIVTISKTGATSHKKIKTFTQATGTYYYDGTNPLFLDAYDIYRLKSIKLDDANGAVVTSKFQLDNGQRPNYYDEGRLIPIETVRSGELYVEFDHYTHGDGEYFNRNSYPADNASTGHYLKDVPTLRLSNGDEVDLKDCIDFRPTKATLTGYSNNYGSINNSAFHSSNTTKAVNAPAISPASPFIMDAEIWLPRIDKLVLGRDGKYSILKGVASETPVPPEDPADSMVVGNLRIKPFVYDAKSDVLPSLNQYKRYTMKHIGELDKRIKKLEYYTSLSLMEQQTFNISLNEVTTGTTGGGGNFTNTIERFKNGIFTDQFKGHAQGNVEHPSYHCAVDSEHSVVRPMFDERNVNLVRAPGDTGVVQNRSIYTLPYTSTVYAQQEYATETEFINPYNMFTWIGTVRLSPDSDEWKDVDHRPDVLINDDSQFDQMVGMIQESGILGTVWNEWETDWTGVDRDIQNFGGVRSATRVSRDRGTWTQPGWQTGTIETVTTTTGQSRTGLNSSIREDVVTTETGDQVIQTNFIPFIRSREIYFRAEMLKPNTRLYAFFNDIDVTGYCGEKAFIEFTDQTNVVEHTDKTAHDAATALITDDAGIIEGSFYVPNNEALRFRAGERVFRLTDSSTNNLGSSETNAETIYRAQGLLDVKQNTITSTKVARVVTGEVNDDRVITDRNINDNTSVTWFDPLAQSILITEKGGIFVTELDIFLNAADPSIPVNVSIREMVNGYPTQRIVPGTETILYPSSNNASSINSNQLVVGNRYKIKVTGGQDFTTVGAINSDVGTVFRATGTTTGSSVGKVDDVNVIYTGSGSSMITDDGSVATTAVFANPVFLSQDAEYAIVLISNSDAYKVFVARSGSTEGDFDLITGNQVRGQPYGGSFFMSQNASTWTADQERDLKFTLKKAQFSSSANIKFVNDQIPVKKLPVDPFFICTASTSSSAVIRVSHRDHGMMEGSSVTISGSPALTGSGGSVAVTAGNINKTHTISDVEIDSYCITTTAASQPTENSYGGGSAVNATENMTIDVLVPYAEMLNLPDTSISATFDSFSGRSQDGPTSQGIFTREPVSRPLTINRNHYLDSPIVIASTTEHAQSTGNIANITLNEGSSLTVANKSFGLTINFSTTNPNLTPMLDGDRASLFCVSNRTNHVVTATEKGSTKYNKATHGRNYIADTAAKGNSNLNNYITREITLANEATHLNFYADVFKPIGSDILLYFKVQTAGDDVEFDDLPWTLLEPTSPILSDDTSFGEVEYGVKLSDIENITDVFTSFAFKVVMVTTNSSRVPMFSNVRAIAST